MLQLVKSKPVIVQQWLERTLETYPGQSARFLAQEKDRFRNPVGHALREGLPVLFDELAGEMNAARITPVLDSIVRIRAVQDFTPSQAVAFVFLLKRVLWEHCPDGLAALEEKIDQMALLAFDLFVECREKICELKVEEARRSVYLPERMASR